MKTDVFAHKPAHRPDLQLPLPGIVQTGLDQLATQTTIPNSRRDTGVREDYDIPHHHVIKRSLMTLYCEFEPPRLLVVCYVYVFSFQGFSSFQYEKL